jgi:hypothetical protein
MASDMEIIKQIEKQTGTNLGDRPGNQSPGFNARCGGGFRLSFPGLRHYFFKICSHANILLPMVFFLFFWYTYSDEFSECI